MIEGIVGGVVALSGFAWFKHHQKTLKAQEAELVEKAAPELVRDLIFAVTSKALELEDAAGWREAALKRLEYIYAGEVEKLVRPGFTSEVVEKAGELLRSANANDATKMRVATLLNELATEVTATRN